MDGIIERYKVDIKSNERDISCGTGKIKTEVLLSPGNCLPGFDTEIGIPKSICPQQPDREIHKGTCGTQVGIREFDPEKAPPCGFAEQTLPGMQSDTPTAQSEEGEKEKDARDADTPATAEQEPESLPEAESKKKKTHPTSAGQVGEEEDSNETGILDSIITELTIEDADENNPGQSQEEIDAQIRERYKKIHDGLPALIKSLEERLRRDKDLTAEQKTWLDKVIKELKNRHSRKPCEKHGQMTSGGMHQLENIVEFDGIIPSREKLEALVKRFDGNVVVLTIDGNDVKLNIWIDYEHIFTPVISIKCEKEKMKVDGFHHDCKGKVKESGVIDSEVIIEKNEHGIYKIKWSYDNSNKKPSTMFPDEWPHEKVVEKIHEALNNPKKIVGKGNDRQEIVGTTKEGIDILVIIDVNFEKRTGKIVTAHPVLDR